jgi:uncharacterized OsmC-like protein
MNSIAQIKSTRLNGVDVNRLQQTISAIGQDAGLAKFRFRLENQWLGGGYNRSTVRSFFGAGMEHPHARSFELFADEPPVLLGADAAASAGEFLLHALAACITGTIAYHAAARGIEIEEIDSSVEGDVDLRGFLGLDDRVRNGFQQIRVKVRIKADVPDDELQALCDLGPRYSPVFDTLAKGLPVKVSAERAT